MQPFSKVKVQIKQNFKFVFLQGKSQEAALQNLYTLYWPVLKANWTYLSLLVFINIRFVPPIVSKYLFFGRNLIL